MEKARIQTLPNYLSALRMALSPVLLLLAWQGNKSGFITVVIVAFFLDAVDGPIARRLHQETELGPRLDSWADVSVYLSLPLAVWWLWPDLIRREWIYVLLIVGSILLPMITGLIKFRQTTSYHTWLVKTAAAATAIATMILLFQGPAMPFRLASLLCVAAGMEEVLITLILDEPRSNVRSVIHVVRNHYD